MEHKKNGNQDLSYWFVEGVTEDQKLLDDPDEDYENGIRAV